MDISFEKIKAQFISKKGGDGVVGVDIGSGFLKVVELHKKGGKAILDTYGELALGPLAGLEVGQAANLTTDQMVSAINDLFGEAKVKSRNLVFSLPLKSTLVTVIEMPDVGEAKLREMIPIEARKYIPTSVTEVSLSHWIIPKIVRTYIDPDKAEGEKSAPPKVDVLLAAVHNDVLAKYDEIAKKLLATSHQYEIEIFSAIRATLGRDTSATMIVDVGSANTKVAIIEEGVLRSSHLINVGSQDATLALSRSKEISMLEAEEMKREFGLLGNPNDPSIAEIGRLSIDRIFSEAGRILMNYQHAKRVSINKVVLSGGGVLLKGLPDVASKSFEATVVLGEAFDKLEAPAALAPLLKESGPEFAVAIGLALRNL
ncbi:MAG: Type IV pilus assembly protein PilM [Parcubacteria group bacterium GW2011_GWA2_47_7]|nr:MAG: Type IV pilus assembly protein PilM [Parcubacteria group bacterium GW2011_GWA2_47_7]